MTRARVFNITEKKIEKVRKEVVDCPPTNADTILLKMYKEEIDRIFCMDCVTECVKRDASCWKTE